jgi:hypothetical protein
MRRALFFCAAATCAATAQTPIGLPGGAGPVFAPAAAGGVGRYYEVVSAPNGVTWSAAQAAALQAGGSLAAPATAAENAFVFNLVDQP